MNIYVGNLAREATEDDVRKAFEAFGQVAEVRLIMDKFSGEPKGYGFVEMPSKEEAEKAMAELNAKDFMGKALNVNEARPRVERGGGGGGRRGGFDKRRGGGGGGRGGFDKRRNRDRY